MLYLPVREAKEQAGNRLMLSSQWALLPSWEYNVHMVQSREVMPNEVDTSDIMALLPSR